MSPQTIRKWEAAERWIMRGAGAVALFFLIRLVNKVDAIDEKMTALITTQAVHELRLAVHDSRIETLERKLSRD